MTKYYGAIVTVFDDKETEIEAVEITSNKKPKNSITFNNQYSKFINYFKTSKEMYSYLNKLN